MCKQTVWSESLNFDEDKILNNFDFSNKYEFGTEVINALHLHKFTTF